MVYTVAGNPPGRVRHLVVETSAGTEISVFEEDGGTSDR